MPSSAPLRRLLGYAPSFRRRILLATSCSVLNKLFDLAPPLLIGVALDIVIRRDQSFFAELGVAELHTQLWLCAGLSFVVWTLESVFEYLLEVLWRGIAQDLQHELRLDAYAHVQRLELQYFEDRSSGELLSVLSDDVNQLERFLDIGANDLIQTFVTMVTVGILFFVLAPSVAWLAVLPIPVVVWGSFYFQRILTPRYREVREGVGLLNSQLVGNLEGVATIKSFTAEEDEAQRIGALSEGYRESNRKAIRPSAAFTPLIRFAILFGFLATLVRGGYLVLDSKLEASLFATMTFLTQRLLWPLTSLGKTFDLYQRAMASVRRILGLLDVEPKIRDGKERLALPDVRGELRVEGLRFAYREGYDVLQNLDLVFEKGKTSAVVGSTGAGKSTLIKILLRFYDPVEGAVRLDGRNIASLRLSELRQAIGFVSQDVFLFHGSVRENIAFGRRDASFEEIVAAARNAEAHEFIQGLPEGYDTIVGERGQKLSGGQRQRISIARAVLKDPPVLILDEATSSVDNETEAAIQRSLERLAKGRTTIVIAHRLSTVRHADCIYVLENGKLREEGHHDELVTEDGIYAGLWKVQTGALVG